MKNLSILKANFDLLVELNINNLSFYDKWLGHLKFICYQRQIIGIQTHWRYMCEEILISPMLCPMDYVPCVCPHIKP